MVAGAMACLLLNSCGNGNKGGKEVAQEKYTWEERDGKWGMVDKDGNLVVEFEYDRVVGSDASLSPSEFENEYEGDRLWAVMQCDSTEGKWGIIDDYGKVVLAVEYDEVWDLCRFDYREGFIPVAKDGKWGYVNLEGKEIIPLIYDMVYPFCDGLAVVSSEGKYGAIDMTGAMFLPIEYDTIASFADGKATAVKDGEEVVVEK